MFKHASIFKITLPTPFWLPAIDEAMQAHAFEPVGSTQELSVGWIPPRGDEHGLLVENVGGQLIVRLMIERREVPGQALRDGVDAACKIIEAKTGRKPGKKERREISDEVRLTMLPKAFPRRFSVLAWIDPAKGLLVIDSASSGTTDHVTGMLIKAMKDAKIEYHQFNVSPATLMTGWLHDRENLTTDERFNFDVGRGCQLKANDETKAVVTYKKHPLDTDEVKNHILQGKYPTRLNLTYADRVAFTLTDSCLLNGVVFLDTVFEAREASNADRFDADVTIMTGELTPLIKDLHEALDLQP